MTGKIRVPDTSMTALDDQCEHGSLEQYSDSEKLFCRLTSLLSTTDLARHSGLNAGVRHAPITIAPRYLPLKQRSESTC